MDRQICVDCRRTAPQTDTDYTLISGKFGWRLHRRKTHEGWTIDWRCPDCWRAFKKAHEGDPDMPRSVPGRPSSPGFVAVRPGAPSSAPAPASGRPSQGPGPASAPTSGPTPRRS